MEVFTDMNNNTIAKENLWADRIKDFQDSGLSRKKWCQIHEISLSTFSYWIRKLQTESAETETCNDPVFAKLPSGQEIRSGALSDHAPVTIFLPESIRIEIGPCCPKVLMTSLLQALKGYA